MSSKQTAPLRDDDAPEPEPGLVLRILAGVHAGASRAMQDHEMLLVGSSEDCDVVLADPGVARHHALINLSAGSSTLRALDAPLRIDGSPLQPGDPVELRRPKRIEFGDAAIAYGNEEDPAWLELLPEAGYDEVRPLGSRIRRRLPLVAALAVCSLLALAVYAAVMPAQQRRADTRARLQAIMQEYHVADGRLLEDVNGAPVISGTVRDDLTRTRIAAQLEREHIHAGLDLRSGQDIAADVAEVMRTRDLDASTRYLGDGVVKATGRFEDMDAVRAIVTSRSMREVPGVRKVLVSNLAPEAARKPADAAPPEPQPVRIVSIVRGEDAHATDIDGNEYPVGATLPGRGQLVAIGESAHVIDEDGKLHKLVPKPVTAAELVAARAGAQGADGQAVPAAAARDAVATTDASTAPAVASDAAQSGNAAQAPAADSRPNRRVASARPPGPWPTPRRQ